MNESQTPQRPPRRRRWAMLPLFLAPAASTLALGSILAFRREFHWEQMNLPLLAGSVAATLAVLAWSLMRTTPARLAGAAAAVAALAWGAEFAGLRWGFLFGDNYRYHDALQPTLAGVPLFVLMGWFVIAQTGVNLVADLPTARSLPAAAALGGLFVAAHAVLLDPLAVSVDAWDWLEGGPWYGTPVGNLAGWAVVGFVLCLVTAGIQRRRPHRRGRPRPTLDAALVLMYFALMATATLSAHVRLGSALPGLLALAIAGPYWLLWSAGRRRALRRVRA